MLGSLSRGRDNGIFMLVFSQWTGNLTIILAPATTGMHIHLLALSAEKWAHQYASSLSCSPCLLINLLISRSIPSCFHSSNLTMFKTLTWMLWRFCDTNWCSQHWSWQWGHMLSVFLSYVWHQLSTLRNRLICFYWKKPTDDPLKFMSLQWPAGVNGVTGWLIVITGFGDVVKRSPSGAGHLNKIKYTGVQLGATAILGCCKGYACVFLLSKESSKMSWRWMEV